MENLVENHGLSWIAIKALDQLDDQSLANARLTKSTWRDLIDDALQIEKRKRRRERRLVHKKMENLKLKYSKHLFKLYPEWKNIFDDFQERRNLEEVKRLCELITKYFECYIHISSRLDPLMLAVELQNDISVLELVLPSVKSLRYTNRGGRTVLHKATIYGRLEMVKLILNKYPHLIDFEQKDGVYCTVLDEAMLSRLTNTNIWERNQILRLYQEFEKNYKGRNS